MIVYSLVPVEGSWCLFVTTDEGDMVPGKTMTAMLRKAPIKAGVFGQLVRAVVVKPGDVHVTSITPEEAAKLGHPNLSVAPKLLDSAPEGVETFLRLSEMLRLQS